MKTEWCYTHTHSPGEMFKERERELLVDILTTQMRIFAPPIVLSSSLPLLPPRFKAEGTGKELKSHEKTDLGILQCGNKNVKIKNWIIFSVQGRTRHLQSKIPWQATMHLRLTSRQQRPLASLLKPRVFPHTRMAIAIDTRISAHAVKGLSTHTH